MAEKSPTDLAFEAVRAALDDAGLETAGALCVGNMLGAQLHGQGHLGALLADAVGLEGVEAVSIDAACASGAMAFRQAYLLVASATVECAVAVGVEKMTDVPAPRVTAALVSAADARNEAAHGASFPALNALLMRRYQHEHGVGRQSFAGFALTAHANAESNPRAMFRRPITLDDFMSSRMVADPIAVLDASPIADGAAAVVLVAVPPGGRPPSRSVRIRGGAVATDRASLHDRRDVVWLAAAERSSGLAYAAAGVQPTDLDFFELHDAFTIISALSLEACGFAERGRGTFLALDGEIGRTGRVPISTRGGLKARGHPVGASGLYQIVEAVEQIRGTAGGNQVPGAALGMTQSIGGGGTTVVTHILEAWG